MKKVLHLASWYPNNTSIQEGDFIQRYLQAISLFQPTEVICVIKDVNNIPLGKKTEINQIKLLKETIVYYHPLQSGISFIDKIISRLAYLNIYKKEIKKYINKNGKPDLIHVHVAMHAGLAATWAKRKYKIDFIVTEHWGGYMHEDIKGLYFENKQLLPFVKFVLKKSKEIWPVSVLLQDAIKNIYNHPRMRVVANVVDETLFNYQLYDNNTFKFLHVSTMSYHKNAEGIFMAFDKFIQENVEAELICLGPVSESLENFINKNISEKGKEKIIFKGVVSYKEVSDFMKKCNVLIINSVFETFSCVAVEALLCGLPVISTPVGILPDIINKKNGIIINNENELLAAMKKIFINHRTMFDKKLIANEYKGAYSYEKIGEQIVQLYDVV